MSGDPTPSAWPATRWQLTAPESFVLLNGPRASGSEAFKLGVMELVTRGALRLDNVTQGRLRRHEVVRLRDGPRAVTPRERALEPIWSIYQRTPSHSFEDGEHGTRVENVARAAARHYGKLSRYIDQDVLPALVERGLFERKEGRILWIFPTTRHDYTSEGLAARAELQTLLDLGQQGSLAWRDDPNRALDYATVAGAAVLMQPDLFPYMRRSRADLSGTDTGYVGAYSSDDDDTAPTFDFDFSSFDLGDFGGFDAAFDSGGGGDGGGGDGGGGDGGGGGNGGGGGK
jgi:uncharacterized membrane protein YgcG